MSFINFPWNKNKLTTTAFDTPKVSIDTSIAYGMFTYDVNDRMWIETFNGVERPKTSATSENKKLKLVSNGGVSCLRSLIHPRYRANRGIHYADSGFIPDAVTSGTPNGRLYFVRRTTVDGVTTETPRDLTREIDATQFDLSKGNIKDFQVQWRGVGNQGAYINLKQAFFDGILGTLDELSVSNPAMPIAFECTNQGEVRFGLFTAQDGIFFEWKFNTPQETTLFVGCVDVSSEGGGRNIRQSRQVNTGIDDNIYADNNGDVGTVMIAYRVPETINYNGNSTLYTRDSVLKKVTCFCRGDEINVGVYRIRNTTAFDAVFASDGQLVRDSFSEYIIGGTDAGGTPNVSALQTAFEANINGTEHLLKTKRGDTDQNAEIDFSVSEETLDYITAGDIYFVVVVPDAGTDVVWATLDAEEEV